MRKNYSELLIIASILLALVFISFNFTEKNNESSVSSVSSNKNLIGNHFQNDEIPKTSTKIGKLNLTNYQINGSRYYHNDIIQIEGKIFKPLPPNDDMSNYNVCIVVDGVSYAHFNDTTDIFGNFNISYRVSASWNIYSIHIIQVNVTDDLGPNIIQLLNHFVLYANATSNFDIDSYNYNAPQLPGGTYNIPGFLRFDNGTELGNKPITYNWYNKSWDVWPSNGFSTSQDGSFQSVNIPRDNQSDILYLNLTYFGETNYINESHKVIKINLYRNITCDWNIPSSATEGQNVLISGQVFSIANPNLKLNFTEMLIRIGGSSIGNIYTDEDGIFSILYSIPTGSTGNNLILVELFSDYSVYSNISFVLSVSTAPIVPAGDIEGDDEETTPPFQNFFIVFIPIIICIVAVLIAFGWYRLRKQEKESKTVKLPLEDRIRNFKILKDTGRLEESLSYLFQSIYMELVNAKYGRRKEDNETIRDFAIISVKEFKINPALIYPFIQNIERIIYDKPFIIGDSDFYAAVELFSPIYFELTGFQFVLNF